MKIFSAQQNKCEKFLTHTKEKRKRNICELSNHRLVGVNMLFIFEIVDILLLQTTNNQLINKKRSSSSSPTRNIFEKLFHTNSCQKGMNGEKKLVKVFVFNIICVPSRILTFEARKLINYLITSCYNKGSVASISSCMWMSKNLNFATNLPWQDWSWGIFSYRLTLETLIWEIKISLKRSLPLKKKSWHLFTTTYFFFVKTIKKL